MTAAVATTRKLRDVIAEARLGAREAQYELGLMYANGAGVRQDMQEALAWVRKAADKGLAAAQYLLATQHAAGQDTRAVHALLTRAAEQGHLRAIHRLARLHETAQPQLAFGQMMKAAEAGLAEAQCAVGLALVDGRGVDADRAAGLRWLQKAAAQHHAPAMQALGRLCDDIEAALRWYRQAAALDHAPAIVALAELDAAGHGRGADAALPRGMPDRRRDPRRWTTIADPGDADGRYALGLMFERGIGVTARRGKAKHWFTLAAQQGDARARAALGRLHETTEPEVAIDWYRQAAAQGDCGAQRALGRLCSMQGDDPARAFEGLQWYARAAQGGEPVALLTLGHLLGQGQPDVAHDCFRRAAEQGVAAAQVAVGRQLAAGDGVAIDLRLAADWYRRAAEQGDAEAQCALGVAHLHGQGVMQSTEQAFQCFRESAAQGHAQAQWQLGALYASGGEGVAQDLRCAFAWCEKAAGQGFAPAQATLGLLHVRMGQPEKAFDLWMAAAREGDGEAQYNLATLLARGDGCPADARAAFGWFARAAERGIALAQSQLALRYATGDGVATDPIEAHKWFVIAARNGDSAARENRTLSASRIDAPQVEEAERRASAWNVYRGNGDGRLG